MKTSYHIFRAILGVATMAVLVSCVTSQRSDPDSNALTPRSTCSNCCGELIRDGSFEDKTALSETNYFAGNHPEGSIYLGTPSTGALDNLPHLWKVSRIPGLSSINHAGVWHVWNNTSPISPLPSGWTPTIALPNTPVVAAPQLLTTPCGDGFVCLSLGSSNYEIDPQTATTLYFTIEQEISTPLLAKHDYILTFEQSAYAPTLPDWFHIPASVLVEIVPDPAYTAGNATNDALHLTEFALLAPKPPGGGPAGPTTWVQRSIKVHVKQNGMYVIKFHANTTDFVDPTSNAHYVPAAIIDAVSLRPVP